MCGIFKYVNEATTQSDWKYQPKETHGSLLGMMRTPKKDSHNKAGCSENLLNVYYNFRVCTTTKNPNTHGKYIYTFSKAPWPNKTPTKCHQFSKRPVCKNTGPKRHIFFIFYPHNNPHWKHILQMYFLSFLHVSVFKKKYFIW